MASDGFPATWYQVAWSADLPVKGIKPIVLCGRHLVAFRGEDGVARVLDAHCPHLGAHLGYKGKVCDNRIKCGFHGWEFGGDGSCQEIPTSTKITARNGTRSWPVVERYGIVFVYFDPQDRAPGVPFPTVDALEKGEWGEPVGKAHVIHARQSEVLENGVDNGHFQFVHNVPLNGPVLKELEDGTLRFQHQTITRRAGFSFDTPLEIGYFIPGLQVIHLGSVLGRESVLLSSVTPTTDGTVVAHLTLRLRAGLAAPVTRMLTELVAYFINDTFAEDIPIWDNKIYRPDPVLVKGDENISMFRRWYARFPVGV